jgi:hypothetical protein
MQHTTEYFLLQKTKHGNIRQQLTFTTNQPDVFTKHQRHCQEKKFDPFLQLKLYMTNKL